ncbi:MAG: hypothetical protein ABIG44_04415 [Planctomycetota bacterium]
MSKTDEELQECGQCGASIYPEHVKKGTADYFGGKLLCPHCLQEKKAIAAVNPAAAYHDNAADAAVEEPIALALEAEDEMDMSSSPGGSSTQIRAFGGGPAGGTAYGAQAQGTKFKRPLLEDSESATRCRTFHCKLTDSSLLHLDEMVNEWVDDNPEIHVKFATSCIGILEGKSSQDPHLLLTVFY